MNSLQWPLFCVQTKDNGHSHFEARTTASDSPPASLGFFSSPGNLREITPSYMGFEVHSDPEFLHTMYAGQVIVYTVRPVLGIPLEWMTEITHVEHQQFFVDEQRSGPYSLWHHQHHFKAVEGGVEMTDLVHYKLPFGWLGSLAYHLFIKGQLDGIFEFRRTTLEARFGVMAGGK
jgi:ligand-binding SRPBCC domain-containing protein